jgi:hypothetical protein
MARYAVLALLLTLSACGSDFWNRPATIPSNERRPEAAPSNFAPGLYNGVPQ